MSEDIPGERRFRTSVNPLQRGELAPDEPQFYESRKPLQRMQARQARLANVASEMPDDYQSALTAVTGTKVDLRGPSTPAGGFVTLVAPGTEGAWWTFAAFGTDLFSVDFNSPATEAWAKAVGAVEDIDHEIFSGRHGLMDVQRLRDAETLARGFAQNLAASVDTLKGIVTPLENDQTFVDGTAVSVLLDHLHLIGDALHADEMEMITHPSPAVADILHDAAEALATFGRQMAYIYWESNQVLLNAIANGWNGVFGNMIAYLEQSGLVPGTQQYQSLAADPAAGVAYARLMIGRYSSTAVGTLPSGMAPISGDLSQGPVWAALNAAITHMISVELDKMDVVARKVVEELQTAYDTATTRLEAAGVSFPMQPLMRGRAIEAPLAQLQPATLGSRRQAVRSVNPLTE